MSTAAEAVPKTADAIKVERMSFGRWVRIVGWRHVVAIAFVIWALFPVFYVITLAFSGGNTLTVWVNREKVHSNDKGKAEATAVVLKLKKGKNELLVKMCNAEQPQALTFVLGHGDAFAYPYGFANWTTAAIVWPLFGDWTVTLWSAVGALGCIAATFYAFPELRRGYWAAAVIAKPAPAMPLPAPPKALDIPL